MRAMRIRTIIAVILAVTICFGATTMWTADTTGRDGDTDANIIDSNGSPTGDDDAAAPKKGGNKFAKIFKAPFKAISKLFGGNRDQNRVQRLNESDVAKFESAPMMRVSDNVTHGDAHAEHEGFCQTTPDERPVTARHGSHQRSDCRIVAGRVARSASERRGQRSARPRLRSEGNARACA